MTMNSHRLVAAAITLCIGLAIDHAWANPSGIGFGTTSLAADAPAGAAAATGQDGGLDIAAMARMNPRDMDKFLKQAAKDRLRAERQQVAAEIRAKILYDAAKVDEAVKLIDDKPADTQADNIARFLAAFAMVETKFQGPYKLYNEAVGQKDPDKAAATFDKAAQGINLVLNSGDHTNLGAAEHYLYAAALKNAGKTIPAVEAFNKLAVDSPERISFAAAATMEAARLYETLERNIYAMDMYSYCLANYGLTLDPSQAAQITGRLAELKALYDDPMTKLAGGMGQVRDRLNNLDTGKTTQAREKQIAMVLRDIIQTAQEQESANPPPPDPNAKPSPAGDPRAGDPTAGPSPRKRPGPRPNTGHTPASISLPPVGEISRPGNPGQIYDPTMTGNRLDKFPPREQDRLHALVVKVMSERYRDIISQYTVRISNLR